METDQSDEAPEGWILDTSPDADPEYPYLDPEHPGLRFRKFTAKEIEIMDASGLKGPIDPFWNNP
jgi:hypothetical protein